MKEKELSINSTEIQADLDMLYKLSPANFNQRKYEALGINIPNNFKNDRIKEGKYIDCFFKKLEFVGTGFSGSHFVNCELTDCDIIDCNLQYCDFTEKTGFYGVTDKFKITSSNLSQSMFYNCIINNVEIRGTTISQAQFINTEMKDVDFGCCTLQDNLYLNVTLNNISLVGCNCEFSEFLSVKMQNVILPLHQIPYAYGLLQCMDINKHNNITVKSLDSKTITAQEYLELLPALFNYYKSIDDYFPAINILLYQKEYALAVEYIYIAFLNYLQNSNFRKIKGICKLIVDSQQFDKHFMAQLYFKLMEYYNSIYMSEIQKHQYSLHINDIKNILTGIERNNPSAQFVFKSNLSINQCTEIGTLHYVIEQCMLEGGLSSDDYTIELRHNSAPISFWVMINSPEFENIIKYSGLLFSSLLNNWYYITNALEVISNAVSIAAFAKSLAKPSTVSKHLDGSHIPFNTKQSVINKQKALKKSQIKLEISTSFFNVSYERKKEIKG